MYDIELVKEILHQILWSAQTITKRFASITSPEDFAISEEGLEKLDGICMQLIAIGGNVVTGALCAMRHSKLKRFSPSINSPPIRQMTAIPLPDPPEPTRLSPFSPTATV